MTASVELLARLENMQTPATNPDRDLLRKIRRLLSGFDALKQLFLARRFDVLANWL